MTQQAEPDAMPVGAEAQAEATPEESARAPKRVMHADGFGAAFCASMAGLCAEAVIGGTIAVLVMLAREHDGLPHNVAVIIAAVLGIAFFAVLVSGFVTGIAVMPALALARRVARRAGRAERLRWDLAAVPVVAALVVAAFGGVAALGSHTFAPALSYALWWAGLTAGLLPATLVAAVAGRRVRKGRARGLVRRVARDGALAWLAVAVLGAGAYGTGLVKVYEPPRLHKSDLAGTWTDGHGGTVKLDSDGVAVAEGLDNYVWDETGKDRPKDCDGSGNWKPVREGGKIESVAMRIKSCELSRDWSVGGTQKKPRIYHEIGKPGSGKRYVLTKVVRHKR
ncbi:hypothetical protein QZH56_20650 [Streptomyces olivoreticuli]|uniref:hypothetical protein n=1 Tax=Streptomyces olivoreticuli TaxID=68246 RepID=UPI002657E10E|nr:hypothetical protein [Streptomyces olivoreticuli]WKK21275.1 hypothetical protein QZH56_20650 [Streptomyces olivoreticuli]